MKKDINAINQLWFMFGGRDTEEPKVNIGSIGSVILMGVRFYSSSSSRNKSIDWLWFYSFSDIVAEVTNNKFELFETKKK